MDQSPLHPSLFPCTFPTMVFVTERLELTTREDLRVAAVKGQAEDVGAVLSLQLHRLGASVEGFFHVPQEHAAIVSPCRHDRRALNHHHHLLCRVQSQLPVSDFPK